MAKQQTLTIVVADDMADPADLVESALARFLHTGPVRPDDDVNVEAIFDAPGARAYLIIEEAGPSAEARARVKEFLAVMARHGRGKDDGYELWGQATRPDAVITLGDLRALIEEA